MFQTSESTELLDIQMAKAQGEFLVAVKNARNPHFKNMYADLGSIIEAVRPALAKHEIHVTQWLLDGEGQMLRVLTRISHKNQFMQAISSTPVQKFDAQGIGSAATYLKRYALAAALNISSDIDDDGESSVGRGQTVAMPAKPPVAKPAFAVPKISELQLTRLHTLATKSGISKEQASEIIKSFGYESSKDITVKDYLDICNKIEGKK